MAETHPKKRPTPIADRVAEVSAWYHDQTGLGLERWANGRILILLLYLEKYGLETRDCRMAVVTDPLWAKRSNRSPAEGRAELVGRTQTSGRRPQYWYVMPAETAEGCGVTPPARPPGPGKTKIPQSHLRAQRTT